MKKIWGLAAVVLVVAIAAVPACSKKDDKTTNPPPAKELNSAALGMSATYVHTFNSVGTFPYHCTIHPSMTATVTVTSGGPTTPLAIGITLATGFNPASPTVGVGTVVTWTNNDATNSHTVTSD